MSQGFKLRYDQIREGDPGKTNAPSSVTHHNELYDVSGHARSLCLVWPDNTRMFFNYAYLISGAFSDTDEKNVITLNFSGHSIQIKGFGLESIFMALLEHVPRIIVATDERYVTDDTNQEAVITEMFVEKRDE
ncbi:hypothetical protein [Dyadobacter frigoris]|uniref:Uncharacterized protein n=1 Tax=Dyadobacter frigoris TaxID=2576211 RepID=A0A4U6DAT4_9BACT|nr:hypothetical protein [Dyadobacter frigoris]TKT93308.1 hypothetical protein FDK13_05505 [Dyadobacter frigoris]